MSDSGSWIEIVLLAMLAGFIGLRLVSVLGRRTGSEKPAVEPFRPGKPELRSPAGPPADAPARPALELAADTPADLRDGLQKVAAADAGFDPQRFASGAQAAYKMILEAFWAGDLDAVRPFVSDEVLAQFRSAVEARRAAGLTLENRLVRIDRSEIVGAHMHGQMAEVAVRFEAEIAAVTRDKDGNVVAGSTTDAAVTHDVWEFSRHVGSQDPNWLLVATDADAEDA